MKWDNLGVPVFIIHFGRAHKFLLGCNGETSDANDEADTTRSSGLEGLL